MGLRYIPNNFVGIVEKLWSRSGSVPDGRIIAIHDEAGFQSDLLRGGFHFGLWRWQYRLHRVPLVTIPQSRIGYVYARDGEPLEPSQTLDPMLSAYFRDVAHKRTMLELLQQRDAIQHESRQELRKRFQEFDIECVDVLIGKPDTAEAGGKIETLLEQLRLRQLSIEQIETFERQRAASEKLRGLSEAQAQAAKQTELTNSRIQIQIAENQGEADLAQARKRAEQMLVTARADSQQRILAGKGEGARVLQTGIAEASVLVRKINSFGDPRLYALLSAAERLANSNQPLVPERVFVSGTAGENGHGAAAGQGLLGTMISLLVAEKSGFAPSGGMATEGMEEMAAAMTRDAMQSMQQAVTSQAATTPAAEGMVIGNL
jgi:uncharacterized membrane protein YqiK